MVTEIRKLEKTMKILNSFILASFFKETEQRDIPSLGKKDGEFNVPSWTDELDALLEEELELELQNFENIPEPDYVYYDGENGKIKVDPESFALIEKMLAEFKSNQEIDFEMTPGPTPHFSIVTLKPSSRPSDVVTSTTSTTTTTTSTTTTSTTTTSTSSTSTTSTTLSSTTTLTTESTTMSTTQTTTTMTSTTTTIKAVDNETEIQYLTIDLTGVNMSDEDAVRENVNSILATYFNKKMFEQKPSKPFFDKLYGLESSFCISAISVLMFYLSLLL